MVYLGALIFAAGLFLTVFSIGRRRQATFDPLTARLKIYDRPGPMTEREIELQTLSFGERIVVPLVDQVARWLGQRTPDVQRQALRNQLDLAGRPAGLDPDTFIALRIGLGISLFLAALVVGALLHNPLVEAIGAAVGAGLGYYFPLLWLRQKVQGRQKEIRLALPDVMDLLTISVEAGLSFDMAVQRVIEKSNNSLGDELNIAQTEIRLGRPRLEALDAVGRRCGVDDLHNFVQAVVQSEQMGVGMSRILRLQSDEIRRKRRQRAQGLAAQATLKMMLPMVVQVARSLRS